MSELLKSLLPYGTLLTVIGGGIGFFWTVIIYILNRQRELAKAEFERFHDVMRKIQTDDTSEDKKPFIEVQVAAIYELGFLSRYHPLSIKYLEAKKIEWQGNTDNKKYETIGVPAIELALAKIKRGNFFQRIVRDFKQFYNS